MVVFGVLKTLYGVGSLMDVFAIKAAGVCWLMNDVSALLQVARRSHIRQQVCHEELLLMVLCWRQSHLLRCLSR